MTCMSWTGADKCTRDSKKGHQGGSNGEHACRRAAQQLAEQLQSVYLLDKRASDTVRAGVLEALGLLVEAAPGVCMPCHFCHSYSSLCILLFDAELTDGHLVMSLRICIFWWPHGQPPQQVRIEPAQLNSGLSTQSRWENFPCQKHMLNTLKQDTDFGLNSCHTA